MSGGMITTNVSGKADVVLTTKGDLATWTTERVRKGVSATNYTGLQADSSIADGLTYGASARSTMTGTADMIYSSAANTLARLAVGTSRQVLQTNSATNALEWSNSPQSLMGTTGDLLSASGANTLSVISPSTSGHVLTSTGAASLPTFQAAAGGGGGNLSLIEHMILTSDETSMTSTFTAVDQGSEMAGLYAVFNGARSNSTGFYIRLNGIETSTYTYAGLECKGGTVTASDNPSNSVLEPYLGGGSSAVDHIMFQMFWSVGSSTMAANGDKVIRWSCQSVTDEADISNFAGINSTEPITSLDEIKVIAASGNILDGSTLDVYKITV